MRTNLFAALCCAVLLVVSIAAPWPGRTQNKQPWVCAQPSESTLDPQLQSIVASSLRDGITEHHAMAGYSMLIDNISGNILALAGQNSAGVDEKAFLFAPYEPGSVMKPLTIAAALDTGAITTSFTYHNVPILYVQGLPIVNAIEPNKDIISLRDILQYSMNIGAATVIAHLGNDSYGQKTQAVWSNYLRQHYGFGRNPDDVLPDRVATTSTPYRVAVSSFGTYLAITPSELIGAYAAIANKGVAIQPRACSNQALTSTKVLKAGTAVTVSNLLSDLYAEDPSNIHPAGYTIGGKTGTVDLVSQEGYYRVGQDVGTYIGFISSTERNLGLITILDRPNTTSFASHEAKSVWERTVEDIGAATQ